MPRKRTETVWRKTQLTERRKKAIERLRTQKERFARVYENQRLSLQAKFAGLVQSLSQLGIKIDVEKAKIRQTKRKPTGHLQLIIAGITADPRVDWQKAKQAVTNADQGIAELIAVLEEMNAQAKGRIDLHSFPKDIPENFAAIKQFVLSQGNPIVRTGKKRVW